MIIDKNKSFIDCPLRLDPILGCYVSSFDGHKYDRVSWALNNVQDKFDAELISWQVAKSECKTLNTLSNEDISVRRDGILKGWADNAKLSTDFGSMVDGVIEDYILSGQRAIGFEKMLERMQAEIFDTYDKHQCQQMVHIDEHKVAGCIDYLGLTGRKFVDVWDWKTSLSKGVIEFYSKRNKYFKDPVKHLSDCSYNRYALQTSCYGYMLMEQYGFKIRKINICFIPETSPENFQVIPVPFMYHDAKNVLRSYRLSKEVLSHQYLSVSDIDDSLAF
jgi:hypothetical protein